MSDKNRVIAEGNDFATNAFVRVVVGSDPGTNTLPWVIVERRVGNDAVGKPRWEPVPEPDGTRIALGTLCAKFTFMDALAPNVPVPATDRRGSYPPNLTVHEAAKTITKRLLEGNLISPGVVDGQVTSIVLGEILEYLAAVEAWRCG